MAARKVTSPPGTGLADRRRGGRDAEPHVRVTAHAAVLGGQAGQEEPHRRGGRLPEARPAQRLRAVVGPPFSDQPVRDQPGQGVVRDDVVIGHPQQGQDQRSQHAGAILARRAVDHHRRAALGRQQLQCLPDLGHPVQGEFGLPVGQEPPGLHVRAERSLIIGPVLDADVVVTDPVAVGNPAPGLDFVRMAEVEHRAHRHSQEQLPVLAAQLAE